jgi:hypothetical protein
MTDGLPDDVDPPALGHPFRGERDGFPRPGRPTRLPDV